MPGQESIRLAKKGGGFSFLNAGFRRFRPAIPWPPRLFAETKRGDLGGNSRPFLISAPAFLPGQQENGSERPAHLEMIHSFSGKERGAFLEAVHKRHLSSLFEKGDEGGFAGFSKSQNGSDYRGENLRTRPIPIFQPFGYSAL